MGHTNNTHLLSKTVSPLLFNESNNLLSNKNLLHAQRRLDKRKNAMKLFSATIEEIQQKQQEALEFAKIKMQLSLTPSKQLYR